MAAVAASACGAGGDDVCEHAAVRYGQCIAEVLGEEVARAARRKQAEGIAACKKDGETQAMYRQCLPVASCEQFMGCLDEYARKTASRPAGAPSGSRAEQCQEHVRKGLRGIALGLVTLGETRNDASKRRAHDCLLAETKQVETCLTESERALLDGMARQRQRDCEAWNAALAACILGLPGASNCNPDQYPLWREPIQEGTAGPAVAWSAGIEESSHDAAHFDWTSDGSLVIADSLGVRSIRDGSEVWRAGKGRNMAWVVGPHVVVRDGRTGLSVLDAQSGKPRGVATLPGEIRAVGAAPRDRLVVLTDDGLLSWVTPGACHGPGEGCVARLATLPAEDLPYEPSLAALRDDTIMAATTDSVQVFDASGKRRFRMALDASRADFVVAVPPEHIAVADTAGVALLSPGACARLGAELYLPSTVHLDRSIRTRRERPEGCPKCRLAGAGCVAAYRASLVGSWQFPAPLPGGAVSFNNHGVVERTHLLQASRGWTVKTGGHGATAGDERYVYTVSFGQDSEGPVRLLALARDDGRTVWQTELAGASPGVEQYRDCRVAVRGGWLAARVGPRVFAIKLP